MSEDRKSNVLTGVWKRESSNGTYFTATVERSRVAELLEGCGDYVQVKVNPVHNPTSENSPQLLISMVKGFTPEERAAYKNK